MSVIIDGTNGISDVDGSAATPAIRGSDANTGVFFGTDIVGVSTNGTERVRVDASGNVGIGTSSPAVPLDVNGRIRTRGSSNFLDVFHNGTLGVLETTGGANTPLVFATSGAERARIDSSGNLLVGTTATAGDERLAVTKDLNNGTVVRFANTNNANPFGMSVFYPNANPNNTGSNFYEAISSGFVVRFSVRSNGGIANFSGNNVNLSDRREKTNFAPAGEYLSKICAIPVQTFNYIDQNHEEDPGLTLGVVAQDVQEVAPELVMESNWGSKEEPKMRLSVYQTDLQYALMKCIQEQQAIITALTARVEALEGAQTNE